MKTTLQTSVRRQTRPRRVLRRRRAVSADGTQSVVLYNIPWQMYVDLCDAQGERLIHMTYDRGTLEVMAVSGTHDRFKTLFAYLVLAIAAGLNRAISGFGSFTHRREDLARALEPDLCYYLQNRHKVIGKDDIDLNVDPPPDLAIEIEVSRSALNRLAIFAALGVGEVWRFDGKVLHVHVLHGDQYEESPTSANFPEIPVAEIPSFLGIAQDKDDIAMVDAVRTWARRFRKPTKKRTGKRT